MLRQAKNLLVVVMIKLFVYLLPIKDIVGSYKNSICFLFFLLVSPVSVFDILLFNWFRDIYHTKRMQHISCVQWTLDNKYVISGSDEMCLRLWKAKASEKLGVVR